MSLSLHTFDTATGQLDTAPGTVTTYPGGDIAVRQLEPVPAGQKPIAWNVGGDLDYAALGQWVAFHQGCGAQPALVMPYLPSARGDHDRNRDAQVCARLTAATGIAEVIAVDPHSGAWGASAAQWGTVVQAISAAEIIGTSPLAAMGWDAVIAPDKGAVGRAGQVAQTLDVPLLTAGKSRDPRTGALSGFIAPEGIGVGRFLVVDDICDGGGTFAGLAHAVRRTAPEAELHLWVTHGLFTGRWRENLLPNFASIATANTTPNDEDAALPVDVRQVPIRKLTQLCLSQSRIHSQTTEEI